MSIFRKIDSEVRLIIETLNHLALIQQLSNIAIVNQTFTVINKHLPIIMIIVNPYLRMKLYDFTLLTTVNYMISHVQFRKTVPGARPFPRLEAVAATRAAALAART